MRFLHATISATLIVFAWVLNDKINIYIAMSYLHEYIVNVRILRYKTYDIIIEMQCGSRLRFEIFDNWTYVSSK